MGSINSLWIPTLAVAHLLAFVMWLYAVTRLAGRKTKAKGKQKGEGDHDGKPLATLLTTYPNGHGDGGDNSKAANDDLDFGQPTAVPIMDGMSPLPVELSWTDISYQVLQGKPGKAKKRQVKQILHPCTGRFRAGEAAALMGPSGAGKSTMMDILTGRKPSEGTGGTVRVNGHILNPIIAGKYLSYIGQEDVFLPNLTCLESLDFYSWLSIPVALNKTDRLAGMYKVLETMGLQEVKHSMVGGEMPGGVMVRGLSGGERRRLSVACGLIGNPSLVFLDEPTTGLDSHAALSMVRHMISLTRLGHTIACSIHQPRQEIFNAFDKVVILTEGHQVYINPPQGCCQWFNGGLGYAYRPEDDGTVADWIITLVNIRFRDEESAQASRFMNSAEDVERAAQAFVEHLDEQQAHEAGRDSILSSTMMDEPSSHQGDNRSTMQSIMQSFQNLLTTTHRDVIAESAFKSAMSDGDYVPRKKGQYPQSWLVQYVMLSQRALRTTLRNPSESSLRLVVGCYIGMFAGLVYIRLPDNATSAQPRASTIFFLLMLNAVTPISYMAFYVSDRKFFKMDSANGLYAPSAYYMSTVTAGSPFVVMNTCAGALMAYGLAGLRNDVRAIFIWMSIISLHALVSNQFLVTCIWLTPTQDTAYAIGSTYLTFSLLFCGFYVSIHNMVLSVARGLSWASFSKYTFEALTRNEFQNRVWSGSCNYDHDAILIGGAIPLCNTQGGAILDYLGLNLSIAQGALSLLGFYGLFHITSFLALRRLYNKKDK